MPYKITQEWYSRRGQFHSGLSCAGRFGDRPGVVLYHSAEAKPANQPVSGKQRWGMLVNTNVCQEDCDACVTACNEENGLWSLDRPATDAQWIRKLHVKDRQTGHVTSLPMMCQHW